MYRDFVGKGDDGKPFDVTYTALGEGTTYILVFEGEQPDDASLVRMLESMRPYR